MALPRVTVRSRLGQDGIEEGASAEACRAVGDWEKTQQFGYKLGGVCGVGHQVNAKASPGEGNVEQAPLLGDRECFACDRRKHHLHERVVLDPRREPGHLVSEVEDDDVVGLLALRPVNRRESYV